MEIIKLENQKNDSFFEAECFLHIGEAKEDKNYVAFDLRREDDPLYSCSYYDFEKEKGDKIFHCFDGQDYSWKCYENEVTNDEKLKNEILGNYDILRNSTIRYLKEIIHKNKVDFSKKLIELLEKIKAGEKINKKEFRIELKKVGLYKSIWKEKTEIFDDVVIREIGFEKIMKFIEENNVNRIVFDNGEFLDNEEIGKFIREYTIVEFRDFKPIKDFDMIKMTLEEWNNLKKWKKLEIENNIIAIIMAILVHGIMIKEVIEKNGNMMVVLVLIIITPIPLFTSIGGWKIGQKFKEAFAPDGLIYSKTSTLIKWKLFWRFGPQVIGSFLGAVLPPALLLVLFGIQL